MYPNLTLPVYNSDTCMEFSPHYMKLFEFEKFESYETWRLWMDNNWRIGYYAAFIYILVLQFGTDIMRNRRPFRRSRFVTIWNVVFATISFIGFIRTAPELIMAVMEGNGFLKSLCHLENHNAATCFWGLLFCYLKIFEFGESVFRILRKKPINCFHWFHRLLVCIYCWSSYGSYDPAFRWFYSFSYYVKFLIYGYYAMKHDYVRHISKFYVYIMILQLFQVIMELSIDIATLTLEIKSVRCHRLVSNVVFALLVHASAFVLLFQHIILTCFPAPKKINGSRKTD